MDRRNFLSLAGASGVGYAVAEAVGSYTAAPVTAQPTAPAAAAPDTARALPAKTAAQPPANALPFTLQRFADVGNTPPTALAQLSATRRVEFYGFPLALGTDMALQDLRVASTLVTPEGVTARHELWSHAPNNAGGTSQSVRFVAHTDAFTGFEVTHVSQTGQLSTGMFAFGKANAPLDPGVYVLAGPRAGTQLPPELSQYSYSADPRNPVLGSADALVDFPYVCFLVKGDWA